MTQSSPKIVAVVVSFQPDIAVLLENLELISKQVSQVVLVDNASPQQLAVLTRCQQVAAVMPQTSNRGLGAAHNIGIQYAKASGATHVVIFDQDSRPREDMVANLYAAWSDLSQQNKVSAVGASYVSSHVDDADPDGQGDSCNRGSFFVRFGWLKFSREYCQARDDNTLDVGCQTIAADFLISSGSLLAMDDLQEIGFMDEGLFIDHVDTEWFLRAKHKGFSAFGVCNALMEHGLGEKTRRVKLIRERNVPQHKPFRYYYIFRNSVLLYRRSYVSRKWLWNDLQRLLQIFVFYGLLYPPRWQNMRMMLKGIGHGMANKSGPLQ